MNRLRNELQTLGYYFTGIGVIGVIITGFKEVAFMQITLLGVVQLVVINKKWGLLWKKRKKVRELVKE